MTALGPRARAERRAKAIAIETLPPGVFRSHGALYFITTSVGEDGKRAARWNRLGETWSESVKVWRHLVLKHRSAAYALKHLYTDAGGGPIPTRFLLEMLRNARKNAKTRGMLCTLNLEELQLAAQRTAGRCELTGISFEYGQAKELATVETRRKRVWAPSLDRLDGLGGYTAENVRIVCMAVNIARQEFGDDVLFRIAEGLAVRQISSINGLERKARRRPKTASILGNALPIQDGARLAAPNVSRTVNP